MLAQISTALEFEHDRGYLHDDDGDSQNSQNDDERAGGPLIIPQSVRRELDAGASLVEGTWRRKNLFDASRGEIGLAWSIFKVRGTPDEGNWPVGFPRLRISR